MRGRGNPIGLMASQLLKLVELIEGNDFPTLLTYT